MQCAFCNTNGIKVTIVTANGTKLVANKDENSDLFWGVRGGGGNFGVVTEFIYQLHDQRTTVYAGPLFYPPPALRDVADHVDKWFCSGPHENAAVYYMLMRGPDGNVRRPLLNALSC
jgi:FAD/FMN-containing dehydrogenase